MPRTPPKKSKKPKTPTSDKPRRKPIVLPDDDTGFVRLRTVLGLYPISESSWWDGIKAGKFPKGVKLGPRVTAWRVSEIRRLLESFAG